MEKSDCIAKITAAIVEAQKEVQVVEKSAENPFFKSKYADLPAIVKEYQRVFPKHGLAVVQIVEGKGLRTTITHTSGEWMSGLAELLVAKQDPQGLGSAITYMRRYALAAICGIVSSEDDDDGNAGSHKDTTHAPKSEPRPTTAPSAPSNGKVVGSIIGHYPPKGKGPHAYKLDCSIEYFKTFDPDMAKVIEDLKGGLLEIAYEVVVDKGYKNNMITAVSVAPVEALPF